MVFSYAYYVAGIKQHNSPKRINHIEFGDRGYSRCVSIQDVFKTNDSAEMKYKYVLYTRKRYREILWKYKITLFRYNSKVG